MGPAAPGNTKGNAKTDADIEGGGNSGEYFWNEENRLTEARVNGRSTYFLYNAAGERTVKRGPHGETVYVSEYYQLQNRQQVTKHVFVGTTQIVSKLSHYHNPNELYDSGYERRNIYTYHPDHLGSSNFITDPEGREFEHMEYTPYGETWIDEGTNKNVIGYRFTSKELDTETGLYYFGARYYDPLIARWVSPDPAGERLLDEAVEKGRRLNFFGVGGYETDIEWFADDYSRQGLNWYNYCNNNPLRYIDSNGCWIDTAIDIVSLGISINDLRKDPRNVWNWVSLAADVGSLVLPIASGGGAIVKGLTKADDVVDTAKSVDKAIDTGKNVVYISRNAEKTVQYVGITNDFARRAAEHLAKKGIHIDKLMSGLSRSDARAVEQALIEIHGLGKKGGTLLNKINSIAKTNPEYAKLLERGYELLKSIGYDGGIIP